MTPPAVTLIVHSYNHERFVDECLASISRQTFDDFEVVIVDDCSSDATVKHLEAWLPSAPVATRLIVNERNLGLCASRNIALAHARGEFVAGVSADDFYEPTKLEVQHRFFTGLDGSVGAIFANLRDVDEHGRLLRVRYEGEPPSVGDIFDALITKYFLATPTVMVRRALIDEVGGYDETLSIEDYDMFLKIADRAEFRYQPELLVNKRYLATSLWHDPARAAEHQESMARILLRWYGRSPATDEVILARATKMGHWALFLDRRRGHRVLRAVCAARPSARRRFEAAVSAVPGSGVLAARAAAIANRRRRARSGNQPNP